MQIKQSLNTEEAILAARKFLATPGRLSSFFTPSDCHIKVKSIKILENFEVGGLYIGTRSDLFGVVHIQQQSLKCWQIEMVVHGFAGIHQLQIFRPQESDRIIVSAIAYNRR